MSGLGDHDWYLIWSDSVDLFGNKDEADRHSAKQAIVDQFNRDFPVGTLVTLRTDTQKYLTRVAKPAYLHNRVPVAHFNGINGCYAIEGRVEAYQGKS